MRFRQLKRQRVRWAFLADFPGRARWSLCPRKGKPPLCRLARRIPVRPCSGRRGRSRAPCEPFKLPGSCAQQTKQYVVLGMSVSHCGKTARATASSAREQPVRTVRAPGLRRLAIAAAHLVRLGTETSPVQKRMDMIRGENAVFP